MQIQTLDISEPERPIWRLAFRAGFLCGGLFAVLAMARWLYWMLEPGHWGAAMSPWWWHAHEMIFGFAAVVVAGFLLTAVANWTGQPGTSGWRLQLLFGAWLAARLVLWFWPQYLLLAWAAEMLFFALLLYEFTRRVWPQRQWRNVVFVPAIVVLALFSSASYTQSENAFLSQQWHYGGLWMITVFVVIVGGRVIPLFTGNRLGIKVKPLPAWFEYSTLGITAITALLSAAGNSAAAIKAMPMLCLLGAILHGVRLWRWQGWRTGSEPLLWSMHLSYLCIPLAMLGLAVTAGQPIAEKNLMHLLAIGTIGGMILTMMSRVSLGHTGRPLQAPRFLAFAFGALLLGAALRALLPLIDPNLTPWAWRISAGLWITAFALFCWRYLPILSQPRTDGRPG